MKKIIIHPFLFTLYTILALINTNLGVLRWNSVIRLALVLMGMISLVTIVLNLLLHSWYKAGILSTFFTLLFSSFIHLYNLFQKAPAGLAIFGQADVLLAAIAALFIIGTWWIIRGKKDFAFFTYFLNVVALSAFLLATAQIALSLLKAPATKNPVLGQGSYQSGNPTATAQRAPDIYYLILDEYGRSDVLRDLMDFDNSEFIRHLEENGFYVPEQSVTNYSITFMSLASSLNMVYLDDYTSPDPGDIRVNYLTLGQMIAHNRVQDILQKNGYTFISFATDYAITDFQDAQTYYAPPGIVNNFELEYLNSSILNLFMDPLIGDRSRALIKNALQRLEEIPKLNPDQPKFVFAHIMAGHVPFVFGANGEEIPPWGFSTNSGSEGMPGRSYVTGYKDQLTYLDGQLETVIKKILSDSTVEPIIIIQGDHGPQSQLDWYSVENTCLRERMSIMNAYYLPGKAATLLYPSITPVNSFRLIFQQVLGLDYEIMPDRSYFATWDNSYDFIDVTSQLTTCKGSSPTSG